MSFNQNIFGGDSTNTSKADGWGSNNQTNGSGWGTTKEHRVDSLFGAAQETSSKGFFTGLEDRIGVTEDMGRMTIRRFRIVPTGAFHDQNYRPLTAHAKLDKINMFADVTEGGTKLNTANIARANVDFLRPSAQASNEVASIANGWSTPRYQFVMEIDAAIAGDVQTTYLLFGYTSHLGIADANKIKFDQTMELYFTRCISMRNTETRTFGGVLTKTPLVSAAHNILFRDRSSRDSLHTLRPEDVIGHAALPKMFSDYNEYESFDARSVLGRSAKLSNISWSNPNQYLSRSLQHYASVIKNDTNNVDPSRVANQYEMLLDGIQDESPVNCAPLRFFKHNSSWGDQVCVTWQELVDMFPEVQRDEVTSVMILTPPEINQLDSRYHSETTHGATEEHIIVARLSQGLPSMLVDTSFVALRFTVTTRERDEFRRPVIMVTQWQHFTGGDRVANDMESFKRMFSDTMLPSLTHNGMVDLELEVEFRLYSSGKVNIRYGNNPWVPFNIPVYAEANFSQMVTNDSHSVRNMSASLGKLMEIVEYGQAGNTAGPKFGSIGGFSF